MRFEGQESSRYKETKGEKWNVVGGGGKHFVRPLKYHNTKKRKTKKETIGTKACLKKTLKYKKWRSLHFSEDSGNGNQEIGLEKRIFQRRRQQDTGKRGQLYKQIYM